VTDHPTNGLDETVHQRHRLGILTITAEASRAEFAYLREALDLTPGNLSRHLTVLEGAGLVDVEKGYEGRRPRTWVKITRQGRSALSAELDLLSALVRQHDVIARRAKAAKPSEATPAGSEGTLASSEATQPPATATPPAGEATPPATAPPPVGEATPPADDP
jgi:DNA-binding MarR family transcriptional regulator